MKAVNETCSQKITICKGLCRYPQRKLIIRRKATLVDCEIKTPIVKIILLVMNNPN